MAAGTVLGGIGTFLTTYGAAIGAVVSIATTAYSASQQPDGGSSIPDQQIQLGESATPIDKTALQKDSELGRLDLGEDEMDKKKRKKGKAAFKIALDEKAKAKDDTGQPATGVQVAKPEATGAQL